MKCYFTFLFIKTQIIWRNNVIIIFILLIVVFKGNWCKKFSVSQKRVNVIRVPS
jgi:uncharacterized membrane protein